MKRHQLGGLLGALGALLSLLAAGGVGPSIGYGPVFSLVGVVLLFAGAIVLFTVLIGDSTNP